MQIPQIEPFQFIRSTAFSERVQLANKINEIIDGINSLGEIPDLQAEIDIINGTISQIQTDIADTDSDVSDLSNQVNTLISEVNGLLKEVISEVTLDSPGYGQVRVKLVHEDETETASNVLQIPVIQDGGITLVSGTTDRSFKIQYVTTDGVTHTTNDFVIPEGGGTDVTVTSISILQGDTANDIKFQIGLSDGSTIQSNSYPIPQAAITPATTSQIGGIKVGTNLSVTADGTLSVDMTTIGTAAAAPTVMWTADASKVTLHFDSLVGTEYTEDVPTAASGGAGTIDAAAYQKLQNVPAPDTIATDNDVQSVKTDLQGQITAISPTVSVNKDVTPPTITVGVNGKTASAELATGSPSIPTNETKYTNGSDLFNALDAMSIGDRVSIWIKIVLANNDEQYYSFDGIITSKTPGTTTKLTGSGVFVGREPHGSNLGPLENVMPIISLKVNTIGLDVYYPGSGTTGFTHSVTKSTQIGLRTL